MNTRIFIVLNDDLEIAVDFTAREFNGINSDPMTDERQPSADEVCEALRGMLAGKFSFRTDLDYPTRRQ